MINLFYLDNNNVFQSTDNSTIIKIEDMLQRLKTFLNEQSFNAGNGIDYISVFNKQSFLNPQIDAIIAQFTEYFSDVTYTVTEASSNSLLIEMTITLFNGDTVARDFVVE